MWIRWLSPLLVAHAVTLPPLNIESFSGIAYVTEVRPPWSNRGHKVPAITTSFHGPLAADQKALKVGLSQPMGKDGRVLFMIDDLSGNGSRFQVEPFFNESVCYHLGAPPIQGNATAQYENNALNLLLGGFAMHKLNDPSWVNSGASKVDGKSCTLYTYTETEGSHVYKMVLCLDATNAVLSSNRTVTNNGNSNISMVLKNYQSPAKDGILDPKGCVDMRMPSATEKSELESTQSNDANLIALANSEAAGTWNAAPSSRFEGLTLAEAAKQHGSIIASPHLPLREEHFEAGPIPDSFDARTKWSSCPSVSRIRNQGSCGSCWAFAANEVLADRVCIGGGLKNLTSSVEYMIDCDQNDGGCGGGFLDDAWKFLMNTGVPVESCDPYKHCPDPATPKCTNGTSPSPPPYGPPSTHTCPTQCEDGSQLKLFKAKSAYAVAKPGDVKTLQQEIMTNGPIEVAFFVFSDFQTYKSGVYFRTPSAKGPLGGHAVRILGWGTENSVDYWLVANSWSPAWGDNGYFKIRRGTNECGIETTPAAGLISVDDQVELMI